MSYLGCSSDLLSAADKSAHTGSFRSWLSKVYIWSMRMENPLRSTRMNIEFPSKPKFVSTVFNWITPQVLGRPHYDWGAYQEQKGCAVMTTSRARLQDGNFYRNNLSDFFIFRKIIKTCLTNLASLSAVLHRLREIGAQPELMTMDP